MAFKKIYVDARCLQDEAFRWRGVGQHSAALLTHGRSILAPVYDTEFVAIIDPALPALNAESRALFDRLKHTGYSPRPMDAWFVQLSPMTHSPIRVARLLECGTGCNAAVVYDFIPHDLPHWYLQDRAVRLSYYNCLCWLKTYDLFLPISDFSGRRLQELLSIPPERIRTTGVAVRDTLISPDLPKEQPGRHVLVVAGGDLRKNVECPIVAHARSSVLNEEHVPLLVVGGYAPETETSLRALHQQHGGKPALLQFQPHLSDEELAAIYRRALVTVCPSRIEGFSIPVIEANANGSPVLVSDCEAQKELVPSAEDQFAADDHERLRTLLEAIHRDPLRRQAAIARQAGIARRFTSTAVADRFWQALLEWEKNTPKRPAIGRRAKPTLAFVTPLPPDNSGVAAYSAACLAKLAERAEIHVYSDTVNPRRSPAYASVQPISSIPYLSRKFDGVVSVLGNSHFHIEVHDKLLQHGGACIAHDARMVNFYAGLYGAEWTCRIASRELGRPVSMAEVEAWMQNPGRLPTLFLSEILEAASPTIVHSRLTQQMIRTLYGVDAAYLPFAVYRNLPPSMLTDVARARARKKLRLAKDEVLVVSFGIVGPEKALEECIWAVQMLRSWGVNARLVFAGPAVPALQVNLQQMARNLDIGPFVHIQNDFLSEAAYQDYLLAADAAVQLRTYQLGGLSGSLLDCVAAVLPTVANAHLAKSVETPAFVLPVPDGLSPVLIAERIIEALSAPRFSDANIEQRNAFIREHNFDVYADRLMQALSLADPSRTTVSNFLKEAVAG
jgi:glycosyltransferase involved in cell wall biosynthesis